jgi:putative ABC transport system permease protein
MMSALIAWLAQVAAVTRYNLRSLPQRTGSSVAAIFGITGVVAVMVGVLSIAQGILSMMESSAAPLNAIVLRTGANTEMMSGLSGDAVKIIAQAPGIARSASGALASPELFVILNLPKRSTGTDANVPLRGVRENATAVRDSFRITSGRMLQWGTNEVIVGRGANLEFSGLEIGSSVPVGSESWPVVGIFEAAGGIAESEIWADAAVLQPAFRRGNSYQAVYVKLESSDAFTAFKDALTADPKLNVKPVREAEYYASQSTTLYNVITGLGTLIAVIMGLGATFGALNTMYTSVAARGREIATLRALGFRTLPVILSVLFESLLLALVGGVIGAGLAWWAFDGFRAATLNWSSFSQIAFSFDVSPALLAQGIGFALLIGLFGGLLPAIRAARQPVATALREL